MMGSGKTTLGEQLATQLGYAFVDLDAYIVQREGRSIADIFEQQGQERFRELERQALEAVVREYEHAVISAGGGAPCFFDNMDFINQYGESIFLDVPASELAKRLLASNLQVRPLLAGKTEDELREFLDNMLEHRRSFYEQARHKVKGAAITSEQLSSLL
ncbi:shikimate kinase [Pontibacter ummariensis]|uniref:Shikimate kinase n=2 Tax=Pontibacter ummariensis TaxID=1610492 RepID=A0A239L351_9BACT|nr:shikimate kinase [Pontibacter ummariensis]SNT24422.1 shikimate kinase [Pontibacter ummariensis]